MAKVLGRLPRAATVPFATLLDLGSGLFDQINYLGFRYGANIFSVGMLDRMLRGATRRLAQQLAMENADSLRRGMCYPRKWDPYFKDYMTVADLYTALSG